MPRVSVVIPAYDSAAFAARAVDSVLAQTVDDCDVIVVDDGSGPQQAEALARLGERPRTRVIRQENQGPGRARRTGWEASDAEFVALLDCDDRHRPTYVERCLAAFDADPRLGAVYTQYAWVDPSTHGLGRIQPDSAPSGRIFEHEVRKSRVKTSTMMVRREHLLALTGLREDLYRGENYDMILRLAYRHPFAFIPEALVEVSWAEGSLSRRGRRTTNHLHRVAILEGLQEAFPDMPNATRSVLRRKATKYTLKTAKRQARAGDRKGALALLENVLETDPSPKVRRRYWMAKLGLALLGEGKSARPASRP